MNDQIIRKEIKIAGVTFDNENGENRQDIIEEIYNEHGRDLFFCNIELIEYEYQMDPAYYVTIDGMTVGSLPASISKKIKEMELSQAYSFWLEAGVIVGGYSDDDIQDPEDKINWGIRATLCLASPEARSSVISEIDKKYGRETGQDARILDPNAKYCCKCGAKINKEAVVCYKCGCLVGDSSTKRPAPLDPTVSPKSRMVALLLCIFLGILGIHRFYLGKIGTGVVWCFTAGCVYVGWIADIVLIACGAMKDKDGRSVSEWSV